MGLFKFIPLGVIAFLVTQSVGQYPFSDRKKSIVYSRLDVDVRDSESFFDSGNWAGANKIYFQGKYAKPRTLKKLSATAGSVMKGEKTFELYRKYWKSARYAHKAINQILKNKGPYKGQSLKFRADAGVKYIQYHSVWMWVIHLMELSVKKCKSGNSNMAVDEWNNAVADYMGSQIVADETNAGYLLHTLAVKRCGQFNTCITQNGVVRAKLNNKIYSNFKKGKKNLQNGKCPPAEKRKNNIIGLMYVPVIQGCIRYIVKTSRDEGEKKQKSHGEGWAFCAAFLPKLNSCSKSVASLIVEQLGPKAKNPMNKNPNDVINQLYSQFKCMGVKCADVGDYTEYPGYPGLSACNAA